MITINNSDVVSFLNSNEFGITEKDLKTDRIEVLETILWFKIDMKMGYNLNSYYHSQLSNVKSILQVLHFL